MKFIIIGKEHRCNTRLKRSRRKQVRKVRKVLYSEYRIHVTLSVQKGHQKIEVTIPVKGVVWFVPNRKVLICMYRLIL